MTPTETIPKGWHWSGGGNPQIIYRGKRITVFERDGGWKFCLADDTDEDDDDPYFSEAYETQDAAMYEAFAFMDGEESLFRPLREIRRAAREERDRQFWNEAVQDAEIMASRLDHALPRAIADRRVNITRLTPVLRKLESKERWMGRAVEHYREADDDIGAAKARKLQERFSTYVAITEQKITAISATRSKNRPS